MYYQRMIHKQVDKFRSVFPVISITGPRQSGKTTFVRRYFQDFEYFNLENPETLGIVEADPASFIRDHGKQVIIDEVQRFPKLLSYIQTLVDEHQQMGSIVISGSQNLLLSELVSQSLAGRAAQITLLPFNFAELQEHEQLHEYHLEQMFKGFYPAIYDRGIDPVDFYNQYIITYVERDVRLLRNIADLSLFRKFLSLLAGRVGQLVNLSSLANDVGISSNTVEDWISVLEASYVVYRLNPFYNNLGKRLIKSPKLYFYDTGLLCRLLNLATPQELQTHYAIGGIFENFIISEVFKHIQNSNRTTEMFFFRDSNGNEIDLLLDADNEQIPVEIKSSGTYSSQFHKGLDQWRKLQGSEKPGFIVYSGDQMQRIKSDTLLPWNQLSEILT